MEAANPFKVFWIGVLEGFTPDMAIYSFILIGVIFLFAVKEKIVFLVVVDVFFALVLVGLILFKWGF